MTSYRDLFPKSFKARDFRDAPEVFTIKAVEPRVFEEPTGKVSNKLAIRFEETTRFWLAGPGEACPSIAEAVGSEDVEDWIGAAVELYEGETEYGGEPTDCVRAREPEGGKKRKPAKKAAKKSPKPSEDFPKIVGTTEDGKVMLQMREGGAVFEIDPEDIEAAIAGDLVLDEPDRDGSEDPTDEIAALQKRIAAAKKRLAS